MKAMSLIKSAVTSLLIVGASTLYAATTSDATITKHVKSNISNNTTLSEFKIDVLTKNGVVELMGTVNLDTDAETIIEIAQSAEGVKDVDTTKLKVKDSKQPFEDTVVTAKVKGEFIKAKLFGDKNIAPMSIHVETKDGTVYLTGEAKTQAQINDAIKIAKKVKNVKDVQSMVKLETAQ